MAKSAPLGQPIKTPTLLGLIGSFLFKAMAHCGSIRQTAALSTDPSEHFFQIFQDLPHGNKQEAIS